MAFAGEAAANGVDKSLVQRPEFKFTKIGIIFPAGCGYSAKIHSPYKSAYCLLEMIKSPMLFLTTSCVVIGSILKKAMPSNKILLVSGWDGADGLRGKITFHE